ncbi:hypothetical protein Tco_0416970 [Tanacetum coccineum]
MNPKLLSNLASKVKNNDGQLLGMDGKPMKVSHRVHFEAPIQHDPSEVPIKEHFEPAHDVNDYKVNLYSLITNETVNGADLAIPLVSVEEVINRFANTLYGYFTGRRLAFPRVDNYCPKTAKVVGPESVSSDGYVGVTHKHQKGKQHAKPKYIGGIRLTKLKPNYYYRLISKPTNDHGEASTLLPKEHMKVAATQSMRMAWKSSTNIGGSSHDSDSKEVENVFIDTANFVEAPPKKTLGKTDIWDDMEFDDMGQTVKEVEHENAYSENG